MDHLEMIDKLRADLFDLNEQSRNIQARADAENRSLTEDEETEVGRIFAEFGRTEAEIDRRTRLAELAAKVTQTFGPKTEPQMPEAQAAQAPARQSQRAPRIEVFSNEDRGKWGFRNFGDFAASVRMAASRTSAIDPRLVANAPTTYSSEGVGEDGGFAVPPDFRQTIMSKVIGIDSLLSRTDQMTTSSNSVTFPTDEDTPWASTGGIQAYWGAEGTAITQSKMALKEVQVRLHKLTCLVPVTDELLADAGSLSGYLNRKVAEKFDYKIQSAIVNGSGAGQPVGILQSQCVVEVAKDTTSSPNQAASTVTYRNIVDMWTRMYAPCRPRSVWLINPDVEGQLQYMAFSKNRSDDPVPVYLPANGVAGAPYATLMGRPVIVTEACSALGTAGDIILADLSQYLTVLKTGGMRQDVSMHLFFDTDHLAFRFIFRVAGMPWWSAAITPANSSNTRSCFVTVAARS